MRRRLLADRGKLDRLPIKKQRVAEAVPSSSFPHWKVFIGWLVLLLLDSMADFRFEYLYPAFMFLKNFYDSYRYQGLIFALLIFFLVVYLDLLCWTVLASPWLFLGASSCVWLEIIRSSDHSFSYSALTLWMLFLYVEVSFRLERLPGQLLSFSRPFAAHCIGYPVVTMSFLIKHQIMHVIRQRQQKKIAEENALYFEILQKALPQEPSKLADENDKDKGLVEDVSVPVLNSQNQPADHRDGKPRISPKATSSGGGVSGSSGGKNVNRERPTSSSGRHNRWGGSRPHDHRSNSKSQLNSTSDNQNHHPVQNSSTIAAPNGELPQPSSAGKVHVVGGKKQLAVKAVPRSNQPSQTAVVLMATNGHDTVKDKMRATLDMLQGELRSERTLRQMAEAKTSKLELEVKKLKADLQASTLQEEETALRVEELMLKEKTQRLELQRFKTESENLQLKLTKLSTGKTHDQASIAVLEKKLKEEEGGRQRVERELREHLDTIQNLCSEEEFLELKERVSFKEREVESVRKDLQLKHRQIERLQQDLGVCHASLQVAEKELTQLRVSLNEESSMKMRLFKALSELGHKHQSYAEELQRKNVEVDHLRQRLAEIMAIFPAMPTPVHPPPTTATAFQPATVTPFAPSTTASAFQVTTSAATFPQSPPPLSTTPGQFPPLSTAPGSFSTPPNNSQTQ